jgi:hypothetical protein
MELSTINPIDVYHPSYTPGLYSNLDAGLCPFSSIQYGKAARKRIAEAVADELLGQARQSDNQLLGGICSAFTSLTLQVGLLLGLLTPEDKKLLIEKSIQRASNELTPKACALKTQITEKFGFLPSDKRVTDPKFDDHINESLGILCEAATQARQNRNQSLLEAVNKYKTRVLRLRNYNLQKAIKNHLYSYLKNLLQAAEKPDLPPESLQGRVATLVKDPLFRLYSRFIMPSTLQGILVRHKTATVQIVPPGQPTLPLTSI